MAELDTSGLRQVGEISNLSRRRLIRSVKNPLDKCTLVSIFPKPIHEVKHTIEPGIFNIPAGTYEKPGILVVGPSSWWREIDLDQPMLEIPVSSIQIADSVIRDYCNGMLGCNMSDSMPGLFFALGEQNALDIQAKFKVKLDEAKVKQTNWYTILVRLADSLWARTNGNPLVIADEMRLAAMSLNLNDKPWIRDFKTVEMKPCVACGALKNPAYPVCPTCKNVDKDHPLAKELKFAV